MKLRSVILFAVLLVLAACSRKEVVPDAQLRTVLPGAFDIELPEGGFVELPFRVIDPQFSFNHEITSSGCQVKLMLPGGGTPEEVTLKSIRSAGETGMYIATIADNGFGEEYDITASLAISESPGSDSYVRSQAIRFRSEPLPEGSVRTGLPIVFVDTEGGKGITSKTEWVPASVWIKGVKGISGLQPVKCSIRGRGNTTWTWPKKPYVIRMDERQSVFGLPDQRRWVLLANFMDRTLMRNLVSMKVASFMTNLDWTPRCQSVELVLNGKHIGNYLLIEQVRVDPNRVNITEMTDKDNTGDAVTGGYLLELDFHYDNEFQWKDHNIPFAVKYPEPSNLTQQQKTYIKNYIAEVAGVIYGNNFKDPVNGYAKYLDVDSFVDYWLVYEIMCNHELGNPGSVYFHKDRGGKLVAGPCWDFDWGVLSFKTSNGENGLVVRYAIWYARLFEDPAFKAKVKARFNELLPQLETIPSWMDQYRDMLTQSAELNFQMWDPAGDATQNGGNIINGDENLTFSDAVDRLKSNYTKHLSVIKSKL